MRQLKKAFTLVEMLVVIVLLTMLIATAVFSYKNMIISIKHTKKDKYKELLSFHQLRSSVGSMTYYVLNRYDNLQQEIDQLYYYFNGSSKFCKYITTNSVFSNDTSVALLSCENDKLVYTETLLYNRQDYLKPDILKDSKSVVLYDNLSNCNLSYITKDIELADLKDTLPSVIHLSMEKDEVKKEFYYKIKTNDDKRKNMIASELFNEK